MATELETRLAIKLINQAKGGLKQVADDIKKLDKSLEANKANLKQVSVTAGIAGAAILAFGGKAVLAASGVEELRSKSKVIFGELFPQVEKAANEAGDAMGRSGSSMLQYATDIGAVLDPLDLTNEAMANMSTQLGKLAVDMASFHNKSDLDAFNALRSGMVGITKPLQDMGIVMTQANLKVFAQNKGLKENIQNMNGAQLATLRYAFIMEQTSKIQGDAVRTGGTVANQLKRLKDNFNNAMEAFGTPALEAVSGVLVKVNSALSGLAKAFTSLSPQMQKFIAGTVAATGIALVAVSGLSLLALGVLKVKTGFLALKASIAVASGALTAISWQVIAIGAALAGLTLWLTKTATGKKVLAATVRILSTTLTTLWKYVQNGIRLMQAIWNVTAGFRQMLKDSAIVALSNFASWFSILGDNITGAIKWVKEFGSTVKTWITDKVKEAVEWLKNLPIIGQGIEFAMDGMKTSTVAAGAAMSIAMSPVADAATVVQQEYNRLSESIASVEQSVEDFSSSTDVNVDNILENFSDIGKGIKDSLGVGGGAQNSMVDAKEAFTDLHDDYKEKAKSIEQEIKQLEYEHGESMKQLEEQMKGVEGQLASLEANYKKTMGSIDQGVGDAVVDQKEKIAELQEQLKDAQNSADEQNKKGSISVGANDRIEELRKKIEREQEALKGFFSEGVGKEIQDAIDEAQRRADLTDFQRKLEDLSKKREEESSGYEEKRAQLDAENEKLKDQKAIAQETYNVTRTELELTRIQMQAFHDHYINNLTTIETVTENTVKSLKSKLEELRQTISKIDSLMQAQANITGGETITSKVKRSRLQDRGVKVANGGIVDRPTFAEIGEGGSPEAVVPLPHNRHIPVDIRGNTGGTVNVSINLGGVTVREEADEDRLVEKIAREVRKVSLSSA